MQEDCECCGAPEELCAYLVKNSVPVRFCEKCYKYFTNTCKRLQKDKEDPSMDTSERRTACQLEALEKTKEFGATVLPTEVMLLQAQMRLRKVEGNAEEAAITKAKTKEAVRNAAEKKDIEAFRMAVSIASLWDFKLAAYTTETFAREAEVKEAEIALKLARQDESSFEEIAALETQLKQASRKADKARTAETEAAANLSQVLSFWTENY